MFNWNSENIGLVLKGKCNGLKWNCHSNGVSIDTRTINPGDIFIAIKGKNFDGHNFIIEAFNKGAIAAIVEKNINNITQFPIITVDNSLTALHKMASYYIKKIKAKVISITGSVGKTTTKNILHLALSNYGISYATFGNFNNEIGMPLCALRAPQNSQFIILEMGMSQFKEIKKLSSIVQPNIAIITNIEPAHLEHFASLTEVADAKSEIFYGLTENSTVILNYDNHHYKHLVSTASKFQNIKKVINFGKSKNANINAQNIKLINNILKFDVNCFNETFTCQINHFLGEHLIYSILCAFAVLYSLKLSLLKLPSILKNFTPQEGRGKIIKAIYNNKILTIIDDSYNANPASVKAALKSLDNYHSYNRKIAILGDMLELGQDSDKYHTELSSDIHESKIDKVHTVGTKMLALHKAFNNKIKGLHFNSYKEVIQNLDCIIHNNDIVLIKGSSGTKLTLIVKNLLEKNNVT